ncbi:MAG: hypothetical protein MSH30_07665 [Campylobacter sp.]|uniref:hypothetical protein n=1 Tax=Campylobacter sp. TaxID=205 RepID=UPI002AA85FBC|nr:hypothetical protein [Campylobacter sp.]MCI6694061.1 hypothetical protein [Campylobacter sp.]MCI6819584.1 hypothetical protein [Campylobacter sp.]MCI7363182.1 hypothetical protein [Campylobacter sp.]
MQGKILSPQLIIGDDGKHYEYDKNDVVNLGNKDLALLTGSQVDFVIFDEKVAKSIYIINENVNVSSILSADSISSARTKALWGIGLLIFSFIPDIGLQFFNFIPDIWQNIGYIIAIVSFVLYSMAIYSVSKAAASKSLFKNYIIALIISFLGFFLVFILAIIFGAIVDVLANSKDVGIGASMMAVLFLGGIIALIVEIYFYKIHAELAKLSGSSLFLWSFWIFVVSVLLYFVFIIFAEFPSFVILVGFANIIKFIASAVSIIAWVLDFIAWWRFGKVEKR